MTPLNTLDINIKNDIDIDRIRSWLKPRLNRLCQR